MMGSRAGHGPVASVLVVDDIAANLLATEAVLTPLGLHVVTASSGQEALKRLLQEPFAAVLLDVHMPEMDGFEAARLIRSLEQTRDIPILFLTALDQRAEHLEMALAQRRTDLIYTPVQPAARRGQVARLVQ